MKQDKNSKILLIVILFLFLLLIIMGSYAWLRFSKVSNKINRIRVGSLTLRLDDKTSDGINLVKEIPKSYEQGINNQEYTFKLINDGSVESRYSITLKDLSKYITNSGVETTLNSDNKLGDNFIRIMLLKNNESPDPTKTRLLSSGDGRVIDSGIIGPNGETITYSLRLWIDSKAGDNNTLQDVMKKLFSAQLSVEASVNN